MTLAGRDLSSFGAAGALLPRRGVLAGFGLAPIALVSGCGSQQAAPEPDQATREQAAAGESELIRQYDAVLAAYPDLSAQLGPFRAQHLKHFEAFGGDPARLAAAAGGPGESGASPVAEASTAAALSQLAAAERAAARARTESCGQAVDHVLAATLALVAASEAQHAAVLAS